MTRSQSFRLLPWVQVLRAGAAGAVAWLHVAHEVIQAGHDPAGWIAAAVAFMPWTAGVDVFFVISGFVIVHASADLFARPGGWRVFLRRRLTRIVPLYWALTTLVLAVTWLSQSAVHGKLGGPWFILASYLFIPVARPDGLIQPALSLGWTLNYEMFFYGLMSPFMRLRPAWAVGGCSAALAILVVTGSSIAPGCIPIAFWSDPIVLEFAGGMGLALAVRHGLSLPAGWRLTLVTCALLWLHIDAVLGVEAGAARIGPPAVLLVLAAVSGGAALPPGRALRWGVRLGDASYAMYLFHPFVMRGLSLLGANLAHWGEMRSVSYIVLSLAGTQATALAINLHIERRLTDLLRRRM